MSEVTKNIQKKPGRPKKKDRTDPVREVQPPQEFWFQIKLPREIIQVLGYKGQILFKALSGQSAKDFKVDIESRGNEQSIVQEERIQKITYEDLKKNRQNYSTQLVDYQKKLLEKLSLPINKNYFFIGQNINFEDFDGLSQELQKLRFIIDQDFTQTFRKIINIIQNEDPYPFELYNYESHKHLVSWALLVVWGKEGRRLLTKLQASSDKQNNNYPPTDPTVLIEQIKEQLASYQKYDGWRLEDLLKYFRKDYEEEIKDLISSLSAVIKQ